MKLRIEPVPGNPILWIFFWWAAFQQICALQAIGQESIRASLAGDVSANARKPSIDASGYNLQLGPALAKLSASLALEVNDNIALSENSRQSDLIVRPSLDANVLWQVSALNALRLDLGIGYAAYVGHSKYDTQSLLIAPNSAVSFDIYIGDFRITIFDQFSLLQNPVDEIDLARVARFDRFQNSAGLTVLWDLNKVILVGGYAHYNYESLNSDFSYLDRSEEQFFFSGSYAATKTVSIGIRGTAALINYRTNFKNNGVLYSFGPYLEAQITPYVNISIEGGYQGGSFDSGGLNGDSSDLNSFYARLQIAHRMNRYLTERLEVGHDAVLGLASNTTKVTYATYSAMWRVNSKATVDMEALYQHGNDSPSTFESERVNRFGAGANLEYKLGRHLSTSLGYWFIDRTSDLPDRDYYQNRVLWSISYDF
jgi:hypothetical protein